MKINRVRRHKETAQALLMNDQNWAAENATESAPIVGSRCIMGSLIS
jgi:hypothetical protein